MLDRIKRTIKKNLPKLLEINNVVFIIAISIAASLMWNTVSAIEKNFRLQNRVDALSEEVILLELENENLELNKEYYKSDDYLELAARETLGLVAAGEKVLVLPDYSELEESTEASIDNQTESQDEPSNFDQWLFFLFRREL